ncbi:MULTISPECIES: hypothetical protein [Methylosinus]|uniref:Uncharacterized protein n=1 Tax=Methylosinus trichosporium (strain ATCC 35070 / NCIMB 11131 / UNIQEM 75 / OB3b) TaxID=595536 RepID=A0A2D2D510_METT3|nr:MULTISPECIES: hypothetical protein [Methylosinus]ATQ70100.1 hypothetical protein CQW49_21070 [Methylosinus trichosporium OB3b]OBS52538.1 hypothetical protein A8B73_10550 [Methylosinus sp. 3S-1]
MALSDDASIERLALRVIDRSLPKAEWTHAGHFAAALWLLRNRPALTTPDEIRNLITSYNDATSTANTDAGGYHHTITLASMRAADGHLRDHAPAAPLHAVLRSLMDSPLGHPDWLLSYWRRDTLFSVAARRGWVEPDLAALPF